jgi:hypothetical protein
MSHKSISLIINALHYMEILIIKLQNSNPQLLIYE